MAVFNALETPHDTHAEVIDRLHRDGARLFLVCSRFCLVEVRPFWAHGADLTPFQVLFGE